MKKIFLMLATAATVCLAACSTETEESITPSANRITISPSISLTRATEVNFEEGDRIGLSIIRSDGSRHAENALLTHDGNVFAGDVTWYTGTDEASRLVAYYPYDESIPMLNGKTIRFTVAGDQSGDGYAQSDLLGAGKPDVEPSASAVDMVFRHMLTKINIEVTNETDADITSIIFHGTIPHAIVNLETLSTVVNDPAGRPGIKVKEVIENELYSVIIVPQMNEVSLSITTSDSKTIGKSFVMTTFKQGAQYTIEATLAGDKLDAEISGEIENWTDEGTIDPVAEDPGTSENSRITWDAANSRYALTTDPTDAGLYFKFGGVVGVYSGNGGNQTLPGTNEDAFDTGDVAWSPTVIDAWSSVPSYADADYPKAITPAAGYHTAANVKAGKGDPCRLVGLDLNRIAATDAAALTAAQIDNGLWRLPTDAENDSFAALAPTSSIHWTTLSEVSGGMFPEASADNEDTFLPAAGFRLNNTGAVSNQGASGYYWTSKALNELFGVDGVFLNFDGSGIYSGSVGNRNNGMSVRCVRQ